MRGSFGTHLFFAASVAFSLPAAAFAQAAEKAKTGEMPWRQTIDLDFSGGPLMEYVEAVRKAAEGANVVVTSENIMQVPVPPVKLRSVSVVAAVELVQRETTTMDGTPIRIVVSQVGPASAGVQPVYRIESHAYMARRRPVEVAVWSLRDLLANKLSSEDVLTAVETAVGLSPAVAGEAELRFHEPTALLVASGTGDQLAAIDRVVDKLREGIDRMEAVRSRAGETEALQRKIAEQAEEIERLRNQLGETDNKVEGAQE